MFIQETSSQAGQPSLRSTTTRATRLLAITLGVALLGCSTGNRADSDPDADTPGVDSSQSPETAQTTVGDQQADVREIWETHAIMGVPAGYMKTTVQPTTEQGESLLKIESDSRINVLRQGVPVKMTVHLVSFETPDSRLRRFTLTVSEATALSQETSGEVRGDDLLVTVTTPGGRQAKKIPWSQEYRGLYAIEQMLRTEPMQPNQRRVFKAWVPGFNQLGTTELEAIGLEDVLIAGRTTRLLRIEITTTLTDGEATRGTLWTDEAGEILYRHERAMGMTSMRTTREIAMQPSNQPPFDLILGMFAPLKEPIENPHDTKTIRYRLVVDGEKAAKMFPAGPSQQVEPLEDGSARVTVHALRPSPPTSDLASSADTPEDSPGPEDLRANSLIQSDHPDIVAMAKEVAGSIEDPWEAALALKRRVRQHIQHRNYSRAFATATEVLRTRTGDCTEHTVLLAALARAHGIPARVVVGLVYTDSLGRPAFGYHAWNEVHVHGEWIPIDATIDVDGIGAAHLKLGDGHLDGISAFSSFLPVARVTGRLKIEVEEVTRPSSRPG